jgi:hypothetical protein
MKHGFWLVPDALAGRADPGRSTWDARSLRAGGTGAVLSVNDGAAWDPEEFAALGRLSPRGGKRQASPETGRRATIRASSSRGSIEEYVCS